MTYKYTTISYHCQYQCRATQYTLQTDQCISAYHVFDILKSLLPLVLPTDTHITTMTQNELFTAHDIHNYELYQTQMLQNYRENAY